MIATPSRSRFSDKSLFTDPRYSGVMNYKLIAIATLVIAPILAMIASHVTQNIVPGQPAATATAPSAAPPAATPSAPVPTAAPVVGATAEFGAPNPMAGQPMGDAGAPGLPIAEAPPPPAPPPSGILPPYPGQDRAPAGGTIHLPDGRTIG